MCRASPGFVLSGFFSSQLRQSQNQIGGSCRMGTVKTLPNNIQEVYCCVQCAVAAYSVHGKCTTRSGQMKTKGRGGQDGPATPNSSCLVPVPGRLETESFGNQNR